jgi:hypothetical protein
MGTATITDTATTITIDRHAARSKYGVIPAQAGIHDI